VAEVRNFEIITVLVNLIRESKIVKSNVMKDYWCGGSLYLSLFFLNLDIR